MRITNLNKSVERGQIKTLASAKRSSYFLQILELDSGGPNRRRNRHPRNIRWISGGEIPES